MPSLNNPYDPGQFFLDQITVPNPAAGAEAVLTIPAGYLYELLAFSFLFVSDGNPSNRYVSVNLENATGDFLFSSTLQDVITSSRNVRVHVGAGFAPRNPSPGFFPADLSWPTDLLMAGSNKLTIRVMNLLPGDALSDIRLVAKQWFST